MNGGYIDKNNIGNQIYYLYVNLPLCVFGRNTMYLTSDKQAVRYCTFNCILFLIPNNKCIIDISISNKYQNSHFR